MTASKHAEKASTPLKAQIERKIEHIHTWEGNNPSKKRAVYFGCYTAAFVIVAFMVLFVYPSNGRSLIWNVDGLEQYYPFFIYEGQWLREIVSNLVSGQGLQIPLWSFDLGYGMDIPSTLDTFFDPLNLLSGLCPERFSEYLFQFLVVFRLYLAGLTFSLLALRFNIDRFSTLVAALLYTLSGTALAVAFWPAGAWPLVLFPLLLLGVEKVLAKERPYLFIISAAAFFIISYYFSYMACLLLIPYCAARVIQTQKHINVVRFILWVLRFVGLLAIGILIACVSLIPSLTGLLGLERFTDSAVDVPLFYTFSYYATLVSGFIGSTSVGSDCYIGFGGLAFLACVLLFSNRKQHTLLKAAFIAGTIMLMLPAMGSLFNGLNYATNRWVWAYALLICFIVARMLPTLLAPSARMIKVLVAASLVFGVLVLTISNTRTEATLAAGIALVATLFVVAQTNMPMPLRKTSLACCMVAGLAINAFYFVSPDEGGIGKNTPPLGYAYDRLVTESPNSLVAQVDDEGNWRYDATPAASERTRNDSLILGLQGIDFYNSSYNSAIDDYHTELCVNKTNINFSYKDLDSRCILDSLAGVKYHLDSEANAPLVYLYNDPAKTRASSVVRDVAYQVHEGSNVLPLAYTYDTFIPRDQYLALSPAEKQEALLQGVVLSDSSLPETHLNLESSTVSSTIASTNGLTIEDGVIHASKPGASLTLTFAGLPDSETYFHIDGLNFTGISPLQESKKKGEYDSAAWYRKALLLKKDSEWHSPNYYNISLTSDKAVGTRQIENFVDTDHMYGGKDEWLVNMGYSSEAQTTITVSFPTKGDYAFTDMSVVCQPMGTVSSRIDTLKADPAQDLTFGTNAITTSVDFATSKVLYFSVPYSKGWTATVDGQSVDIKRANTAFMALELEAGQHHVELHYMSPGLITGLTLSGIGLAAIIGLAGARLLRSRMQTHRQRGSEHKNV